MSDEREMDDQPRALTRRPCVEALEAILGEAMPVLDHGFVRVIDYMGDDGAIVQAARVSYGRGTKKVHEDRGLIRYLMRRRHTTPFEMCELKLHVKLPIFVARQWIRHRTACITGDAVLSFDLPGAEKRGRRQHHGVTVEKLHALWREGAAPIVAPRRKPTFVERIERERVYTIPELAALVERREEDLRNTVRAGRLRAERRGGRIYVRGAAWHAYAAWSRPVRIPMRERVARMKLRCCNEETGAIEHTRVVDVWETGVRPVFRVTLANGRSLKMTKDHRCLTESGWLTLEQATGLRLRDDGGVTWRDDGPAFAVNGMALHRSREWLASQRTRGIRVDEIAREASVSYHTIRKQLQRFGLQFSASERARLSGAAQRGQRRSSRRRGPLAPEALARLRAARAGAASNFWKGGVTLERANVGRWTREHAALVHERNAWRCVVCGGKGARLHAHHVDPVWCNAARARDLANLTTLCDICHRDVHRFELEIAFCEAFQGGRPLAAFFAEHPGRRARPEGKRRPRPLRLARTFVRVARIEYAGMERTYDLAVAGPFHNFVANGLIVHNSVNEYSGRYSILDREFYLPRAEHLGVQAPANRQGRGDAVSPERAAEVLALIKDDAERSYRHYEEMLALDATGKADPEREGIARELARMNLTLNYYTQWYWKIDLHNLFHFLSLRMDDHAQYEIRVYADVIGGAVEKWVPMAWEAFCDYRLRGAALSRMEIAALGAAARGEAPDLLALGMSKREAREFRERFAEVRVKDRG